MTYSLTYFNQYVLSKIILYRPYHIFEHNHKLHYKQDVKVIRGQGEGVQDTLYIHCIVLSLNSTYL